MRFPTGPLLCFALGAACSRADSIADPVPEIPPPNPPVVTPPAALLPLPLQARIVFWRAGSIAAVRTDGSDTRVLRSGAGIHCPRLSPDGNSIAFSQPDTGLAEALWVMDANGKNARPILENIGSSCPLWAPDASKLGVVLDASLPGDRSVQMLAPDGTEMARFSAPGLLGFSPDGRRILISASAFPGAIVSANWDGSDRTQIAVGNRPHWGTPQRIVYECNNGLCSVSPDGSNQLQLVTNNSGSNPVLVTLAGAAPKISPDGKTVAFACTTSSVQGACLLNVADGSVVLLPPVMSGGYSNDYPYQIVWSEDSRTIGMTCQFHKGGGKSVTLWTDICVADRDSRTVRDVYGDADWDQDPTMSPP